MSMTAAVQSPASARWSTDPAESSVEFAVKTFWGLLTVQGRFDRFDGTYETGPGGEQIELTVDPESLDTGNTTRDEHLRSEAFFHVAEHPYLHFASTRIHHVTDELLHVVGKLEAAGTAVEVEFPATVRAVGDALEIEASTTLDQTLFGMSSGRLGMIRRPASLCVKARLIR